MSTAFFSHPDFRLHHNGARHPERPTRLEAIETHLKENEIWQKLRHEKFSAADESQLEYCHHPALIEQIKTLAQNGGGQIDGDTRVTEVSFDVAKLAVGAAIGAVDGVLSGDFNNAFVASRPPGHHAESTRAMGFCLFNNVAIGARVATAELGLDRVLIVDWDVHHGNGTQDSFWEDPQVGFFSLHRYPFYPGTGSAAETGAGAGLGTTVNLPITLGTSRREILTRFSQSLGKFADRFRPQLLLISAGFDAHHQDPIGSLGLESEDFAALTRVVRELAAEHCEGKMVSVLEGGYHPQALAECIDLHWRGLQSVTER